MDENRVVTGLTGAGSPPPGVRQAGEARNDLDAEGGNVYERFEDERQEAEDQRDRRRRPSQRDIPTRSATPLEEELDRMVHTDDRAVEDSDEVKRSRGLHHYREKDPETAQFYRKKPRADEKPSSS